MTGEELDRKAERIAKELVLIATNAGYGDLRDDMVQSLLMREFLGKITHPHEAITLARPVMHLLTAAIESLADEITSLSSNPTGKDPRK